ncbi:MAG TPA: UbiD family decarboxylase [Bacteroidia bacterium]|nr:UbiD family decarboxylase [Bacteroidia bacterium]
MPYTTLQECLNDLEKNGHLIRIKEEVDPNLEMAAIHLRVFEKGGPAVLFEKVKGSKFPAVSNLFGKMERSRFLFRDTMDTVKQLSLIKDNPLLALKKPALALKARMAMPYQTSFKPGDWMETTIDQLPLVKCWPDDGGAFITLPQVYTEDPEHPGVMHSNLGMYRIQLTGNDYIPNKEIGLHYQLHRGIGIHQSKSNALGKPLKVSIFVGGPPAHSFAAVMPLPEGMSELTFAGILGNRRFRYSYMDGYCISNDADFVITGEVFPDENKPEGPFGDHLGYYSLKHDFPVMRVHKVLHKKNAIWPFTVVGRPPQEDTAFGNLIHEMSGDVLSKEIPGLKEVNAVDAAGVHPLLLAIGSERYTPYIKERIPQEIITISNHILGFGQMSLAKYLFICAQEDDATLDTHDIPRYFKHILERGDWSRDLHFQTKTTIDTLDYSGSGLNSGSKVVIAVAGNKRRELSAVVPELLLPEPWTRPRLVMHGVLAIQGVFDDDLYGQREMAMLAEQLGTQLFKLDGFPLIILCDDSDFVSATLNNFLWVTFTRSNPAYDIHGVNHFIEHKHWGCMGPLLIDARIKPQHAPPLVKNAEVEKRIDRLFEKGGPLNIIC